MNLVDSSGWLAFFADTKNAQVFSGPLGELGSVVVPTVVVYEVTKVLVREKGEDAAIIAQAHMQQGHVVDLSIELAVGAALLSHQLRIPMADSMILATARTCEATIWTQDEHFKGLEKVNYFSA